MHGQLLLCDRPLGGGRRPAFAEDAVRTVTARLPVETLVDSPMASVLPSNRLLPPMILSAPLSTSCSWTTSFTRIR